MNDALAVFDREARTRKIASHLVAARERGPSRSPACLRPLPTAPFDVRWLTRLKPLIPILVDATERHGHLELKPVLRSRPLQISVATIDFEEAWWGIVPVGEGAHRNASPNGGADTGTASALAVDVGTCVAQRPIFAMLGIDTDNDSTFMNQTVFVPRASSRACARSFQALTRCGCARHAGVAGEMVDAGT